MKTQRNEDLNDFEQKKEPNLEFNANIANSVDVGSIGSIFRQRGIMFLKSGKTITKILLSEIDYFLAYGNYSKCFVNGKFVLIGMSLKDIEKILPESEFIRIHKSCIIPIHKIDKIVDDLIYMNSTHFPIGRYYREKFYSIIFPYVY